MATARETECLMMMDEFYSHYIYPEDENEWGKTVSSAEYVEDVNTDPIIIVDGLTKNWRCPGWRSMPPLNLIPPPPHTHTHTPFLVSLLRACTPFSAPVFLCLVCPTFALLPY